MRTFKLICSVLGILTMLLFASAAGAANPHLVKDINPSTTVQGSGPTNFIDVNGTLFFATTNDYGKELWKSDGTAPGTVMVKDIYSGISSSNPLNFVNLNGTLFFTATDGINGIELWKSDGTSAGTVMVKDIYPGAIGSNPGNLTNVNGTLFFTATDSTNGTELWKSDGTATGTVMVKDIYTGTTGSNPGYLTNVNGTLFFMATDVTNGTELWKSDGTAAGTVLVKDIYPGATGSSPVYLTNVNGILFFRATDGTNGLELWKSDGTTTGTVMVKDIYSGTNGSNPANLTNMNGTLFFTATDGTNGTELWKSDGTVSGTVMVKDIYSGSSSSNPANLTVMNGMLFFSANDGSTGVELWKSDGTTTVMVKDIYSGTGSSSPASLVVYNGMLYFGASDGINGYELWRSDGSAAGTVLVKDIYPGATGSGLNFLTIVNGALFFRANDGAHGVELWVSHGTASDTFLLLDIVINTPASSYPQLLTDVNGTLFFTADDGSNGRELWKSDDTATGSVMVKDIYSGVNSSNPANLTNVNGTLFFTATDGSNGTELWKSDGTAAGTVMVKDIYSGSGSSNPANLIDVNGVLYFTATNSTNGTELWKSDGSAAGTVMVKDIYSGSGSSNPTSLVNVNGTLFFAANDGINGIELWKSDGTSVGTAMIKDIYPGTIGSTPAYLTNVSGTLFFAANDGTNGTELWKSDGTAAGTVLVKDIWLGGSSSNPQYLTNVNGTLFFSAADSILTGNGTELWKSDGTAAGTVMVKDIWPGGNSYPELLTNVNGTLFFRATDGSNGTQLWKSDGTTTGTVLLKNIYTYPPQYLTNVNGTLFFAASDATNGSQLWKSDGTITGTVMVKDIFPGGLGGSPAFLTYSNGTLFFQGSDSMKGVELFAFAPGIAINNNAEFAVQTSVSLTLACPLATGCSQVMISNDCVFDTEQWQAFAASIPWQLATGDGQKKVCVKFRDASGNESAIFSDLITIDTTPPDATISSKPLARTTSTTTTFTFSSTDPSASFQCLLDENTAGLQSCTSPAVYTLYGGTHSFQVRAMDPAGNITPVPQRYDWQIVDSTLKSGYSWGMNTSGQLGIGSADNRPHALVEDINGPAGFIQIRGGYTHAVALRNDGTVWTWGGNTYGQLGQSNLIAEASPKKIESLTNVIAISAGYQFSLALKSDGTVWEWGSYADRSNITTPRQVYGIDQVTAIAAGYDHVLAIRSDGTAWTWGKDDAGELGLGKSGFTQTWPTIIPGSNSISAVAAVQNTSFALRSDGTIYSFGSNWMGLLGTGTGPDRSTPAQITIGSGIVKQLATGGGYGLHFHVIDSNNEAWGWGANSNGQLGVGSTTIQFYTPQKVTALGNITGIAVGSSHTLFKTAGGSVLGSGRNNYGQIGGGLYDHNNHPVPEQVGYLGGVSDLGCGPDFSLAVTSNWISSTPFTPNSGLYSSLTVDPSNNLHLLYQYNNSLQYATSSNGSSWSSSTIFTGVGLLSAIALTIDSSGYKHACFKELNGTNGTRSIKYVTNAGGNWQTPVTIATDPWSTTEGYCDIAVSNSAVYISYFEMPTTALCGDLKLARKSGAGPWEKFTVESGCPTVNKLVGEYNSIAVDSSDQVHISYYYRNYADSQVYIKYAKGNGASWSLSQIDTSIDGAYTSLALNGSNPAFSYGTIAGPSACQLKYAAYNGSAWATETVDNYDKCVGKGTSLAFSGAQPYIAYYDETNEDLKVAYKTGSNWNITAADTDGNVGMYPSIAADALGTIHISYADATNYKVKYAKNTDAESPAGSIVIGSGGNYATNGTTALTLACNDGSGVGCWQMKISNDGLFDTEAEQTYVSSIPWTLAPGDGQKSVFVKFKDAANNWSPVKQADVFLDTQKPTGSFSVGATNGVTSDSLVVLNNSCSDPGGANASGCFQMKFNTDYATRNDSSKYSTPVPYAAESSIFLPTGDGLKNIYVIYIDRAGNESFPLQASVTLDTSAPDSWAAPGGGSYGTPQSVTLSCDDKGGVSGNSCAAIYYSTDGGPPVLPYSVPLIIAKNSTLKYYAVDALGNGNINTANSAAYTFVAGYTELSLELSDSTIDYNKTETVWGALHNLIGNGANLVGEEITIKVKDPDGIELLFKGPDGIELLPYKIAKITDTDGSYNAILSGFTKKGEYTITASFDGSKLSSLLYPSTSAASKILVGTSAGYAILIEGKIPNDPSGLAAHNKTANRIYQKLKNRGFDDKNIYYFNYDQLLDGVDAIPSKTQIQYTLETLIKAKMNSNPAPLYIIMVDHGDSSLGFRINNESISASDLALWLGNLETGLTNPEALKQKRFVINGSCYSGSFISALSQAPTSSNGGRVIITSAAPAEVSYMGAIEGDGVRSGEFFLEEFFTQLERGYSFKQAFTDASAATRIFTQKGGTANAIAPYFDGAIQHPLLDDNGDGSGSNALLNSAGQDGDSLSSFTLGAGANYSTNSGLNPADITDVTETRTLTTGQDSTILWADVNDYTQVDSSVWIEIRDLSTELNPPAGSTIQANLDTKRIPMNRISGNHYERDPNDPNLSADLRTPFTNSGRYEIYYFVKDQETQKLAPMKRSVVYKEKANNNPPNPVALMTPEDGSVNRNPVSFVWDHYDGSGNLLKPDPDNDPVTYTFEIYENSVLKYRREGLTGSVHIVDSDQVLLKDKNYQWKVIATDGYGATRSSSTRAFTIDPIGGGGACSIGGAVKDSATGASLAGAFVELLDQNAQRVFSGTAVGTLANFSFSAAAGTYNIRVSCPGTYAGTCKGFTTQIIPSVTLVATSTNQLPVLNPVKLVSATTNPNLNITLTGSGGGSVYATPAGSQGGIACLKALDPDVNCSDTYNLNDPVHLTAAANWKSIFTGWTGDFNGSTNPLDITMGGNRSYTATFTANIQAKIGATGYASLQDAYDAIADGSTLQSQVYTFMENVTLNRAISITLSGGLNSSYQPTTGFTTIKGSLTIEKGSAVVGGVAVW